MQVIDWFVPSVYPTPASVNHPPRGYHFFSRIINFDTFCTFFHSLLMPISPRVQPDHPLGEGAFPPNSWWSLGVRQIGVTSTFLNPRITRACPPVSFRNHKFMILFLTGVPACFPCPNPTPTPGEPNFPVFQLRLGQGGQGTFLSYWVRKCFGLKAHLTGP